MSALVRVARTAELPEGSKIVKVSSSDVPFGTCLSRAVLHPAAGVCVCGAGRSERRQAAPFPLDASRTRGTSAGASRRTQLADAADSSPDSQNCHHAASTRCCFPIPPVAWPLQETHGRKILLARRHGRVFATDAHCFHMGGNLWEGDIEDVGGHACVVCPLHRYKVRCGGVRAS